MCTNNTQIGFLYVQKVHNCSLGCFNYAECHATFEPTMLNDYVQKMILAKSEQDDSYSSNSSDTCTNCKENKINYPNYTFQLVCIPSHLIVWAKYKDSSHKPAKVMCIYEDDSINIRYFGCHEKSDIHADDCFRYSKENLNNSDETDSLTSEVSPNFLNFAK